MADRQTDKSSRWSCTAYNDEIEKLMDKASYPSYVKMVKAQEEICPTTGKKHLQAAVLLYTQQRLSALKKWLPTAHWEIPRNWDALLQYVHKDETRDVSGARFEHGPRVEYIPFDKLCELLAQTWIDLSGMLMLCYTTDHPGLPANLLRDAWHTAGSDEKWMRKEYVHLISYLILNGYSKQASAFADNRLKSFWIDTSRSWIQLRQAELS